jgi:poly-D-alanine transfer protein DltD
MLENPATLEGDPVLKFALTMLADGSPFSQAVYYAVLPLGKLQNLALRLQDDWEVVSFIRQRPDLGPDVPRQEARLDWPSLLAEAERASQAQADNNPFGFDNTYWRQNASKLTEQKGQRSDPSFLKYVQSATGWGDLELLLRGLRDLGAEPLILSAPMKGPYYDYWGVSAQARRAYYRKLRDLAQTYGAQMPDFSDHDLDRYFVVDYRSHLSPKGWAYYDQALDRFFHERR